MHIYKEKDGRIVIDFEGDLIVSGHGPIRISDFEKQPLTVTNGVFCLSQNDDKFKDKISKLWFSLKCSKNRILG